MSGISTHVLDLALGKPAFNVPVKLERFEFGGWVEIASRMTTADGRADELLPPNAVSEGSYRMTFNTAAYREGSFYHEVIVSFSVVEGSVNYHLPLLLSPHGYTTYRGS
jgi:5-hydroxyisourate hydrolase